MTLKNNSKTWKYPCSGITIEGSVKSVAVINTIGCILCALMVTRDIFTIQSTLEQNLSHLNTTTISNITDDTASNGDYSSIDTKPDILKPTPFQLKFHYLTWTLLYLKDVVDFIVSIFLFKSVSQHNLLYCKIYFFSTFLVLQAFTVYVIDILLMRVNFHITVSVVIGSCFHLFYKPYSVWIVLNFMKVLIQENKKTKNKISRRLSDEEINEFYVGAKLLNPMQIMQTEKSQDTYLQLTPSQYKKNDTNASNTRTNVIHEAILLSFNKEYEVKLSDFTIDESQILGSGAFGTVYVGKLLTKKDAQEIAVKTTKTWKDDLDPEYLKALLDEVKVMSYIGQHPNIVNILGVCTTEIQNGKVWVLLELCEHGSLQTWLKKKKSLFKLATKKKDYISLKIQPEEENLEDKEITLRDFIVWARDIAVGMEFLTRKKVVHGDLALRNILLTGNNQIKIADFGLSRKLYSYALYARNEETLLPWKWMSPESLRNLTFSQSTDVWAYGVTLWEIFSFGDEPWNNFEYSVEFIKQLHNGAHPPQPNTCPNQIYAIMESCWNLNEKSRPTFKEIIIKINNILIVHE